MMPLTLAIKMKKLGKAGLKKLMVCRHPTVDLRAESVGWDFFILLKVSLVPRTLPLS